MNSKPTAVYRFYAADGTLLYVGISLDLSTRLKDHKKHKPGWRSIARIELAWYGSRPEALAAEAEAIGTENPLWNVYGPGRPPVPSKWAYVADAMLEQIRAGEWAPGARLFPAEEYARQLPNIASVTVRRAIKELIKTGILRGQLGKGVFVAER